MTQDCVELIKEEADKAAEMNDEKRKKIREYTFKQRIAPPEIAKIMGLDVVKVAEEVDNLVNSSKQPIPGATVYQRESAEQHA